MCDSSTEASLAGGLLAQAQDTTHNDKNHANRSYDFPHSLKTSNSIKVLINHNSSGFTLLSCLSSLTSNFRASVAGFPHPNAIQHIKITNIILSTIPSPPHQT
jgi:hypothetical protein